MFVLLNGSFGVGKTTVAVGLRRALPGSGIFDPEHPGFVLGRLPWNRGKDYQDLGSWRRWSILGARALGKLRPVVIVPMTFSELRYLNEVRDGLLRSGRPVLHFCLTASLPVVRARLEARGEPRYDTRWAWVHRRAEECCAAHERSDFATHVRTDELSPEEVVQELVRHIHSSAGWSR